MVYKPFLLVLTSCLIAIGMPLFSRNQRSWFWSRDPVSSVVLLSETRSRRAHRRLSLCRSFSNKFFRSIGLWVNLPTSRICVHALTVVKESHRGILTWQIGVYFSLSKVSQRFAWRLLHFFSSQTPQTRRAF